MAINEHLQTILANLTVPCHWCSEARAKLAELERQLSRWKHLRLSGAGEAGGKGLVAVPSLERLKVECAQCDGRGRVPTEFGQQVLAFVKAFEGRAGEYRVGESVPF